MFLYILVFAVLILIIVLLLNFKQGEKLELSNNNHYSEKTKPCPICHWPLQKREKVHSVVYRSESDNIMHIYGCPYCYREHPKSKFKNSTSRLCPACKKELSSQEYVIARLFEKPGKNHVHVLGCYRCRGKR